MRGYNHSEFQKNDFVGELHFTLLKVLKSIYACITTFLVRADLKVGGVKYGVNLKARGGVIVERFQCSSIEIGDNCTFNSSSRFNFRGINHKCIIQTGCPGARIVFRQSLRISRC